MEIDYKFSGLACFRNVNQRHNTANNGFNTIYNNTAVDDWHQPALGRLVYNEEYDDRSSVTKTQSFENKSLLRSFI